MVYQKAISKILFWYLLNYLDFLTFTNILNNAIVIAAFLKFFQRLLLLKIMYRQFKDLICLSILFSLFSESPLIGFGFGYLSSKDLMSPINWYLMLLAEGGSISFILMMLVLALLFSNVSFGKLNLLAKMSLFNGLSYLVFMSTFYSMGLWLHYFFVLVRAEMIVEISGITGSGKTTSLNALLIENDEKFFLAIWA